MKPGELLMLSTEEYSDQCHSGPYKVLQEFDIAVIAQVVSNLPPMMPYRTKNGPDDVITYLESNKYIEMLPCRAVHLGSYGSIELSGDFEEC